MNSFVRNKQFYKFSFYGFLKNLRFFDAFFILFLLEKGLTYTQIGSLYAIREIVINLFEIPSGIIADTYGRKNALMGSFVIFILSFFIFYLAESYYFFLFAFVLYGVGDAFRSGTHKGMIMDYLKLKNWENQKIHYYGHTRSWSQKGSALSSLIAGAIVFYSGSYYNIFLFSIIPYLINLLLIFSYPGQLNFSPIKTPRKRVSIIETLKSLFSIFKNPKVLKIMNTSALHTAYLKAIKDYIQAIMINVALLIPILSNYPNSRKNGLIVGVIYFFLYLLTSGASKYSYLFVNSRRKNTPFLTLILGFTFGVLSGLFYYYNQWILSLFAFAAIYLIENIRKPILTAFISDEVPNRILTSTLSVQSLWRTIITSVLALGFGIVTDNYGIGSALLSISLVLIVISFLLNITLKE